MAQQEIVPAFQKDSSLVPGTNVGTSVGLLTPVSVTVSPKDQYSPLVSAGIHRQTDKQKTDRYTHTQNKTKTKQA